MAAENRADDASSDDGSTDECAYMLGFVDDAEPKHLLRHRFPSKVGGRPAWLNPKDLPTLEQLTCGATGKQLEFLLQVYATVDDSNTDAFHRVLYLFVSPDGQKLTDAGAVKAFRCQLPRKNAYYDFDPAPESMHAPRPLPEADRPSPSQDPWHVADWEANTTTSKKNTSKPSEAEVKLHPEMELIVEPEADYLEEEEAGEGRNAHINALIKQYRDKVQLEGELGEDELPAEVLDQVEANVDADGRHFAMFQARMEAAPEQCLRYCFEPGASPLWPSPRHVPKDSDIPPCSRCGKARRFEFQVLPQLLNYLEMDEEDPQALDWGSIAVYTCEDSCAYKGSESSAYVEEFVWVQPSV